jgi:hypothetical protein
MESKSIRFCVYSTVSFRRLGAVLLDRFDRIGCFHDQGRTSGLQPTAYSHKEIRHSWHRFYLSCECVNVTKLSPIEIPCGTCTVLARWFTGLHV